MNNFFHSEPVSEFFSIIFKHKGVFLLSVIVMVVSVYISLSLYTPRYTASVLMLIEGETKSDVDYYDETRTREKTLYEGEIIKSSPVIERSVNALRLFELPLDYEKKFSSELKAFIIDYKIKKYSNELKKLPVEQKQSLLFSKAVRDVKASISVEQLKDTKMFVLRVSDFSPAGAVILANSISRSYLIFDLERQLSEIRLTYGENHIKAKQVSNAIVELSKYLDGETIPYIQTFGPASVKIIEQAKEASFTSRYDKKMLLILSLFIGLILGYMSAYGLESLDSSVKTGQDVKQILQMELIGAVKKEKSDILWEETGMDAIRQSFRDMKTKIGFLRNDRQLKTFLITSAVRKEGKTTCSEYLSRAFAESGEKVLLIDADLFNPLIAKLFKSKHDVGLTDYISNKKAIEDIILETSFPNLHIIPGGLIPPNPPEMLANEKIRTLIETVKHNYDIVIVDSPPICTALEVTVLGGFVDAVILIIKAESTPRNLLKEVIDSVKLAKGNILGVVLNFLPVIRGNISYYYKYYEYSNYDKKDI